MIDYIFRNHATGKEFKRVSEKDLGLVVGERVPFWKMFTLKIPRGYMLQQVVKYAVSARERKAK